jgi:hypothetical protein
MKKKLITTWQALQKRLKVSKEHFTVFANIRNLIYLLKTLSNTHVQ